MDHARDHIYPCPSCAMDTLHYIVNGNRELCGIVCTHCHTPSLVKKETLNFHQLKWEDELRQILENLDNPFDEP